jgi:pilus assembly protein Flp/PilA
MFQAIANRAKCFLRSTDGPTATEYAIMLALIIMAAVATIASLGTKASSVFSGIDGTMVVPGGS